MAFSQDEMSSAGSPSCAATDAVKEAMHNFLQAPSATNMQAADVALRAYFAELDSTGTASESRHHYPQ